MTTGELIKRLQEEDPTGTARIRLNDNSVIVGAVRKEGYWDGPYNYINEEGQYTHSIRGMKVDLISIDLDEFVWNLVGNREDITWEEVKEKLHFELGGYAIKEQRDEREDRILKIAKKEYEDAINLNKELKEKMLKENI